MRPWKCAGARHAGLRRAAGLRDGPRDDHPRGQQDRAGPDRVGRRGRSGHHERRPDRAERGPAPAAPRLQPDALERDGNLRPDASIEKLAKMKPVFGDGAGATMTAGNSTPLTDGAAVVLLSSEEWAAEHSLPVLARLVDAETGAVDFVHGDDGLL